MVLLGFLSAHGQHADSDKAEGAQRRPKNNRGIVSGLGHILGRYEVGRDRNIVIGHGEGELFVNRA